MNGEVPALPATDLWVSIDPGINYCSLITIDPNAGFVVKDTRLVKNNRVFTAQEKEDEVLYGSRAVKVRAIIKQLEQILDTNPNVGLLVIEAPFYNSLTPTAYASLLEVIFAIKYLIVIPRSLKLVLIEPRVVKRMFTNHGSAAKEMMRQFLIAKKASGEIVLPFEIDNMSEHEVDGVAIGYVHYLSVNQPKEAD